jgi:hypothetical protein
MKCEICRTIEKLGLEESAHDLWVCADAGLAKTTLRRGRSYLKHIGLQFRLFARSNSRYYRLWVMAHNRPALVTLGL